MPLQQELDRKLRRGLTRERRAALWVLAVVLAAVVVEFLWVGLTRLFEGPSAGCDRSVGSWPSGPLSFLTGGVLGLALLSIPIGHRLHRKLALVVSSGAVFLVSLGSVLFILGWWVAGHSPSSACGSVAGFFGPILPLLLVAHISGFLCRDTLKGRGGTPQPLAED
jgi:hypothetical protein